MRYFTGIAAVLLGGLLLLGLASCRSAGPADATRTTAAAMITLNGAGASFPYPLYSRWIEQYQSVEPGVAINYQSIGSGGGIKQLQAGTVDFGASDAPLSDSELKQMPASVLHLPMVAGAVAVVYNVPGVTKRLMLDAAALADIFLGDITTWNDGRLAKLNPDVALPKLPITVAHRSDGSGTTYLFTSYLAAVSKPWAKQVGAGKSVNWPIGIGGKGSEGVSGVLQQTPGGIGYVELAYAAQNKLAYAALRNAAGEAIAPDLASTTAAVASAGNALNKDVRMPIVNAAGAGAYPISGLTYILIYQQQQDAARGKALTAFLRWAIHDGQQTASSLQYAPAVRCAGGAE